jgi:hypothetical protein
MAALGNLHPLAARARRTGTSAACTRPTRRWRSRTRATSTRGATKGVSIWAVRSADVVASAPGDKDALFEPANSKVYRHPTFFPMPDEVKHL